MPNKKTGEEFATAVIDLIPHGEVWSRDIDSNFRAFIIALSEELARADNRATELALEANPLYADETFLKREEEAGLPDACAGGFDQTFSARRDALINKWRGRGGQTPQFLIDLASDFGFDICITEFAPFMVDTDTVETPLYSDEWRYVFRVGTNETTVHEFTVDNDTMETPLAWWGNDILECVINRAKPAQTIAWFVYEDGICAE